VGDGGLETDQTATEFVVSLVLYFLSFVTLVAVIYIIYAGFQLLISAGDDKKLGSAKNTIIYIILGIVVMWLAYAIVTFITSSLNQLTFVQKAYAAELTYTENDQGTFAEYQQKLSAIADDISVEFLNTSTVSESTFNTLSTLITNASARLPDSANYRTTNDTLRKALELRLSLAEKTPGSNVVITNLVKAIQDYVENAKIDRITANIESNPVTGSAPLTVSLSATDAYDPSGTLIPSGNYTWYIKLPE